MLRKVICCFLLVVTGDICGFAQTAADTGKANGGPATNWYIRFGVNGVIYHADATVRAAGSPVPGASAKVSNNVTGTIDLGYHLLPSLNVSLMAGIPPKPTLYGAGSLKQYGELGSLWYGPAVLSAQYHFGKARLQPYIGPGVAYAIILRKHAAVLQNFQVHNAFAPVLQAGGEYKLNSHWGTYVDLKQIWLTADAHGTIGGVVPAQAHVKLYPTVVSGGFTYRF